MLILALLQVALVGAATLAGSEKECISKFSSTFDYFPPASRSLARADDATLAQQKLPISFATDIEYADRFAIRYSKSYKVVTNYAAKVVYVLYQCNGTAPSANEVRAPSGFVRRDFAVPLKTVAVTETVALGFLSMLGSEFNPQLGVLDRVIATSQYANNPCMQKLLACTSTVLNVPTKFADFYTDSETATHKAQVDQAEAVISSMELPYNPNKGIAFSVSTEPGVLNRAEWIKFLAPFFNLEHEANFFFYFARVNYTRIMNAVKASSTQPMVAFVSHSDAYNDPDYPQYNAPEMFSISVAAYKTDVIDDAGGRTFRGATDVRLANGTLSGTDMRFEVDAADPNGRAKALANFRLALSSVDILIDETYYYDPTSVTFNDVITTLGFDQPGDATRFKFLSAGAEAIYREDKALSAWNGLDWFESQYSDPVRFLSDFVSVIQPSLAGSVLGASYQTKYLRRISSAPALMASPVVMSAATCTAKLPACDATASVMPVCPQWDYKMCKDGTAAFLDPTSGCATYEVCATGYSSGARAAAAAAAAVAMLMTAVMAVLA